MILHVSCNTFHVRHLRTFYHALALCESDVTFKVAVDYIVYNCLRFTVLAFVEFVLKFCILVLEVVNFVVQTVNLSAKRIDF